MKDYSRIEAVLMLPVQVAPRAQIVYSEPLKPKRRAKKIGTRKARK